MELTSNNGKAFVLDQGDQNYYIESERPGLDRRVFRYECNRIGSYLEYAYFKDFQLNHTRARWYGYANRQLPDEFGDLK